MKNICEVLAKTQLFSEIPSDKIKSMTECLACVKKRFKAGETIWTAGQKVSQVGIVIRGRVYSVSCDFWGNTSIISEYASGTSFGEAYALSKNDLPVFDVVAKEDTDVVFIEIQRILTPCCNNCPEHRYLIENLLSTVAEKARELETKINHICARTTRDKLLSYLSSESRRCACANFTIPFNRQELADYLSVERCAMSKELHKMKRDGLVDFSGRNFVLKTS